MNDTILGIIGGMGPEATISFYHRIIKQTQVTSDQDHFRVVIDSNSKIPDRTKAILYDGDTPLPALIATTKNVEQMGAKVAGIPCITAHYYLDAIRQETSMTIVSAIESVYSKIKSSYPSVKRVGVLSTTGTRNMQLFDQQLEGLEVIYPSLESQDKKVMEAIYGQEGIKNKGMNKKSLNLLIAAGNELIDNGADVLIAGCTEIGVVLNEDHFNSPLIDPMDVMAACMIEKTKE